MDKISTLSKVDIRDIWNHEAHDFTPWLASNLQELEKVLGMDLELVVMSQ